MKMIAAITDNPLVDVRMNTTVSVLMVKAPNLKVTLRKGSVKRIGRSRQRYCFLRASKFDPGKETQLYGYYEFDDVITLVDAEKC
jgi:heterodisulfide reductase subunit A